MLVLPLAVLMLAGCSSPPPPTGAANAPYGIDVNNLGNADASGTVALTVGGQAAGQTGLTFPIGRHVFDLAPPAANFTLTLRFKAEPAGAEASASDDVVLGACQGKTLSVFRIDGEQAGVRSVSGAPARCV